MSDLDVLIEQMVSDIWTRAYQLDDQHLEMFLGWLTRHSVEMKRTFGDFLDIALRGMVIEGQFRLALRTWLQSLSAQGMLWEYRLIMEEITWWHDLDSFRLKMIVTPDVEG